MIDYRLLIEDYHARAILMVGMQYNTRCCRPGMVIVFVGDRDHVQ